MSLEELVKYSKKVVERGLVAGMGGNTSLREGNSVYMSPSGLSLQEVKKEDFVKMDLETGRVLEGEKRPTSEWSTHLGIYRGKPDVRTIIHAHPPHLIALLSTGEDLRPITPEHAVFLEKTVTLPYLTPCGEELASAVRERASENDVFLLQNHGVIASGKNVKEAFMKVELVEDASRIQILASRVGKPRFLTEEEISEVKSLDAEAYRKKLVEDSIKEK